MCVSCRPPTGRCGTRVDYKKNQKNKYTQPLLLKNPLVHGVLHMLLLDTGNPLFGLDTGVRGTDRATYSCWRSRSTIHYAEIFLLLRSVQGTLSCRLTLLDVFGHRQWHHRNVWRNGNNSCSRISRHRQNIARDCHAMPGGSVVLLAQNPPLHVECVAKLLHYRDFEHVLRHTFLSSSR